MSDAVRMLRASGLDGQRLRDAEAVIELIGAKVSRAVAGDQVAASLIGGDVVRTVAGCAATGRVNYRLAALVEKVGLRSALSFTMDDVRCGAVGFDRFLADMLAVRDE